MPDRYTQEVKRLEKYLRYEMENPSGCCQGSAKHYADVVIRLKEEIENTPLAAELVTALEAGLSASERLVVNFSNAISNKPVRDMAETIAEYEAFRKKAKSIIKRTER